LTHLPKGITVSIDGRKRKSNEREALKELERRLKEQDSFEQKTEINSNRKEQVGKGMRGDKRRTIRYQDGIVVDHILGTRCSLSKYLKGDLRKFR